MKHVIAGVCVAVPMFAFAATTINFDADAVGALPAGWTAGSTGGGTPKWSVTADPTAPTSPNVLKQLGTGTFPWCVKTDVAIADGFVEVKLKPLRGKEDQAGGLIWRWRSGESYYLARVNALEDNIGLYYVEHGRRKQLMAADVEVPPHVWHKLRVEFRGTHIRVLFNDKLYIETDDGHINEAGAVGVWTKADSVTEFDDFGYDGRQ
ncbi:family 16 glycoside hydrolase [Paraburkholderia graminis]|uniref:3-keto-alpha-glucoside-1,2-lyase/3-keto-2-hydroxy-glucal hydratase domain-containing protein n=1 Tax=Paraburkholderia graminis TaxID=60548 RepID=A0ABD5CC68_9BURK|nr:family 16 glycoside hydrolase [Paraburkholderia graminis]MDR6202155.1 hypothetical protein [Paraburkholderia graminis]